MFVTLSLNTRVFPAIGCLPVLPYAFSGGSVTSFFVDRHSDQSFFKTGNNLARAKRDLKRLVISRGRVQTVPLCFRFDGGIEDLPAGELAQIVYRNSVAFLRLQIGAQLLNRTTSFKSHYKRLRVATRRLSEAG